MNVTLIVLVVGAMLSFSVTVLWQMEKITSAELHGEISILKDVIERKNLENIRLQDSLEEEKVSVETSMRVVQLGQKRLSEYRKRIEQVRNRNENLARKIDKLRLTEEKESMESPRQRGDAAVNRWDVIFQTIAVIDEKGGGYDSRPLLIEDNKVKLRRRDFHSVNVSK
ncbi:hypothetical protein EDC56_0397 [Sinobacterium caligoides]|uniref:Uncharacterized protein n=1 Tax=Sinobacterium caligoides TaxID=933926 RepID=A0A3N2DYG2_9GAMM|nr:hypothetical protein [Sinobacterium caligoides]ROS04881.1 hypothetical protein EDC56_0397 [Sinobacterium caligoides]